MIAPDIRVNRRLHVEAHGTSVATGAIFDPTGTWTGKVVCRGTSTAFASTTRDADCP
jgi:hypothetical protein